MTYKLELWRCLHYTDGSTTACNRSVYTEPGANTPECPFEPDSKLLVEPHGAVWMESFGLFDFEEVNDGTRSRQQHALR